MRPEFEAATLADVEPILERMREYYAADGYAFEPDAARRALEELIGDPRLGEVWVVREGRNVVAYLAITFGFSLEYLGRDAFVDEVVVAPSHQGRGLGTRALELAASRCREAGVRALHLEVEADKPDAERLYRRSGFESKARRMLTRRLS